MHQLLSKIAELKLIGPITLVLDNARYQRNDEVTGVATRLNITLMFLPSYAPNLAPPLDAVIERLWKFVKRSSIYGRYHPSFADFKAAIEQTLDQVSNPHAADLASLMTLNFQQFENVSLMVA